MARGQRVRSSLPLRCHDSKSHPHAGKPGSDLFWKLWPLSGHFWRPPGRGSIQPLDGNGTVFVFDTATGSLLCTITDPIEAQSLLWRFNSDLWQHPGRGAIDGAADAGAAYVFDAVTGGLLRTLANPAPEAGDDFGASVAISGNIALVGSPYDDGSAAYRRAAYLFDVTTGSLLSTLTSPDPQPGTSSATLWQSPATAWSWGRPSTTRLQATGGQRTSDAATGKLVNTLSPPAALAGANFGHAVAICGSTVLVVSIRP